MYDYELWEVFKPIVDTGLSNAGVNGVLVRSYQPTSQGAASPISVAMNSISSKRYGFRKAQDVWNPANDNFDHIEQQQMETTFQMNCWSLESPNDLTQLTAQDILYIISSTLQSVATINTLAPLDMGILRITDIRNPYFENDQSDFQSSPSFDFTVTHKHTTITSTPKVEFVDLLTNPV